MTETTTIPRALPKFRADVRACRRDWILRCRTCKDHLRLDAGTLVPMANIGGTMGPIVMCCGVEMNAKLLKGIVTDHKCGAKCRTSKGHVCECSCGGKHHGRDA